MVAKKKECSVEDMVKALTERMGTLRRTKDDLDRQIEECKEELLPLMLASGMQGYEVAGVGKVTYISGGETVKLVKAKLQGNLLKYLDAADVARVIEESSTVETRRPYVQFSLPK